MRWIVACLLTLILIGCSTTEPIPTVSTTVDAPVRTVAVDVIRDGDEYSLPEICGTETSTRLLAGKHHDAGTITVNTSAEKLIIWVTAKYEWIITTTHLHVGVAHEDLWKVFPLNRPGNPKVGHFIYSEEGEPTKTLVYAIDLEDLDAAPDDELLIAFHAEVMPDINDDADFDERVFELNEEIDGDHDLTHESAWGEGTSFPGRSWAMYFSYTVTACQDDDGSQDE